MSRTRFPLPSLLISSLAAIGPLVLSACATSQAAVGAAGSTTATAPAAPRAATAPAASAPAAAASAPARGASAPAAAAAPAAPPAPGAPPPFATVIREAKRTDGFVPFWRKDERVWLEIAPAMLDRTFLLTANVARSVGERGLYGSTMGPQWLVKFVKSSPTQIQLRAVRSYQVADGAARQAALDESFSESLLASLTIASGEQAQTKAVLIDAGFLLSDIAAYGRAVEAAFRIPYGQDRGNSQFGRVYANAEATTVQTTMHFAVPRLPLPPTGPVPPGAPVPTPPTGLPDARSFLVGFVWSLAKLPEQPMASRVADGRLGHFVNATLDFGSGKALSQRQRVINRWRLEKKDPAAEFSEPVKPITFWLDKNIPPEYRASVTAGVLEWNKAFEKIGFKNAIVARQQPDDADWDSMDATHASLRWYFTTDPGASASGPSNSDPRTGEILDADIKIGDGWTRVIRREAVEEVTSNAAHDRLSEVSRAWLGSARGDRFATCGISQAVQVEMQFALDTLIAQGQVAPDSPEAEAFVQDYLKGVVMHEVGHTLGLKHNFKASTVFSDAQLADPAFTEANGVANSVMDYTGTNLPLPGERKRTLIMHTLGPYDYWAIEYAYRPLAKDVEARELERIASRSTEPLLAFADDADADGFGAAAVDPLASRFDIGADPAVGFERRLKLTQDLWRRASTWRPLPGEDAQRQRGMVSAGFGLLQLAGTALSKTVGGMNTVREVPRTDAARGRTATFVPVPAEQQRRALNTLTQGLFSADSFRLDPGLIANLAPDYVDWTSRAPVSVPSRVLAAQTATLDRLYSPITALRLIEAPLFVAAGDAKSRPISLSEVYATLQSAIWSELKRGGEIDLLRRNLQRDHLRRVQSALLRGGAGLPPDASNLIRLQAGRLQADLRIAAARPGLSDETRAHLSDSLTLLSEALRASMERI